MMRKATLNDLPDIMGMVQETVAEMHSYGNWQWDDAYPCDTDFINDIDRGDLYVAERNGTVAGFVCINRIEPAEYKEVPWSKAELALVIHRMVVGEKFRRQKVGSELVNYAEELARRQQVSYLKTDTYSLNTKAQSIFEKCGYRFIGTMIFRGLDKPFYCYEKVVA